MNSLPPFIQEFASLKPFNTFAVAATARALLRADSIAQVLEGLSWARNLNLPVLVLGGGSNVLFTRDFPGLVLLVRLAGQTVLHRENDEILLDVSAGENWHQLVTTSLSRGWYGLENLSLIPGTVGAAPIQNIGAYGVELDSVLAGVTALERDTGRQMQLSPAQCAFGYRDSVFKHRLKDQLVITAVQLRLSRQARLRIDYGSLREELEKRHGDGELNPARVADAVCAVRRSRLPDPAVLPNAGSFFKNPLLSREDFDILSERFRNIPVFPTGNPLQVKIPAAWLLENCGWKGRRVGKVGVHEQHPLVIVNPDGGSGAELWALAQAMAASVLEKFAIQLDPELTIV